MIDAKWLKVIKLIDVQVILHWASSWTLLSLNEPADKSPCF
jgi:hypothetical protein